MTKSVLARIANGAKWTALTRFAVRVIGLASTIILARLLTPHDFGLVALGMIFISFLTLLGNFDFETVLIQHPNPSRQHYDTAWTFNALYFSLAALVLTVAAPLLAKFYATPQLTDIIHVLAAGFFLKGLANVRIIDFQKHFRFHNDAKLNITVKIAGFCTTVTAAFLLRSYWALLIGMLVSQATYLLMSYVLAPYRPRPTLSKSRELFGFSFWLILANIVSFINAKSIEMVIGKILGIGQLGVYTVGQSTASMATSELTATVNRAAYPGYAKVSDKIEELKRTVLQIFGVIATVAFPASLGFYSIAVPFVLVVLGEKWLPAVPVLEIIAIAGMVFSLQSNLQYVFFALGRPRLHTLVSTAKAVMIVPLVYVLAQRHGIAGAASSVLITSTAFIPVNLYLLRSLLNIRPKELLLRLWRPAMASMAMAIALHLIAAQHGEGLGGHGSAFPLLIGMVLTGIAVYSTSLLGLWWLSGHPSGATEAVALHWLSDKIRGMRRSSGR